MTRREFEDEEDGDEMTASEIRRFASLPRSRPVDLAHEDRLIALLVERGVVARSHHLARWLPFTRAAAAVAIFAAGALAGYWLRQPGRPRSEAPSSTASRVPSVRESATSESPAQPARNVSNATRQLIWF